MSFVSPVFLALLGAAVVLFHCLPMRARSAYLLILSYAFYATWSVRYVALLLGSTLAAYLLALRVAPIEEDGPSPPGAGAWLSLALLLLVAPLFFFKYLPALVEKRWGIEPLLVPLGISYYTFRLISYVVDVYWGKEPPQRGFLNFALYGAFFPQMVSGPIQRSGAFFQQLQTIGAVSSTLVRSGLRLILFGLFKKLVIADRLGLFVSNVFDAPHAASGAAFLVAAYAFAVQLYADFSGITDIAIGMGRLFGIESPPNFDSPFYAPNIQAFWRRWHMSLTSWLTDYVFTPVRMQLRNAGNIGLVAAIFVNMIAVGVWHGANWTFVAFGGLNGVYMAVSVLTLKARNKAYKRFPAVERLRAIGAPLLTFHLVVLAFVFFRASNIGDAWYVIRHLIPSHTPGWGLSSLGLRGNFGAVGLASIAVMELIHASQRRDDIRGLVQRVPRWARWASYYAAIASIVFYSEHAQSFIYARF